MSEFNIFYAWQSDLPPETTRYFIRDAAKAAIAGIKSDVSLEESPRLDSDTKGEAGMPEIATTIFGKIAKSGIFLADLTFVGQTLHQREKRQKNLPNPNVLLELGHASTKVGWDRMICVMNTVYGPSEEVIFDIKHRRSPITYHLDNCTADESKCIQSKLTADLRTAISACMQAEHQGVEDALKSLDRDCFEIMSQHGSLDLFSLPMPRFPAENAVTQVLVQAARHMSEIGLVETHFDFATRRVSYIWTYMGKLVTRKLGFR